MSIVKMKRLVAIVPSPVRRDVLRELYRLGCVEVENADEKFKEQYGDLLRRKDESTGAAEIRQVLNQAVAALSKYAPEKTSIFTPRHPVTERVLFDRERLDPAINAAREVVALSTGIDEAAGAQNRLAARIASLRPWEGMDVALEYTGKQVTSFHIGMLPAAVDFDFLAKELEKAVPAAELSLIFSDNEQHYITLLVYRPDEESAMSLLKSRGLMAAGFKDLTGTPGENIAAFSEKIDVLNKTIAEKAEAIRALAPMRKDIGAAADAYAQESGQDSVLSSLAQTEQTVVLTGWVPESAGEVVGQALEQIGCAWQLVDPQPGDSPPTAVHNNPLVDPFTGVTEMYGTPTYGSVIDPNPFVSIFYFIFFGFMMADAMYGLIMMAGTYLYLRYKRPSGGTKRMIQMFFYCGISTFIAGVLTGGWFADSVEAVSGWVTGGEGIAIPALWFNPLDDPMRMLTFSLVLGAIQMTVGMCLAAWRMIKLGRPLDAVFDVGSWFVVFVGVGMMAMGMPAGSYTAGAGAFVLLVTGGRKNKGLGKITGGLGSLYGITGFISDLLSYSRIMALGMSGAVVGQVVNKIAVMGSGLSGILLFVGVFAVGHVFNIAICLLGAYVHTCRLQYIEFFGRFFEDGGRPFKPLINNTKYVEIIKED
jgi:V/A-type H+-transporting ATPase subunit I